MGALEAVWHDAYESLRQRMFLPPRRKEFRVRFFPYAGLRSVVYRRPDHVEVRLGDILRDAPTDVHDSLARILLGKLDRRLPVGARDRAAYDAWARSPEATQAHEEARRARGRKPVLPSRGVAHDLDALYSALNERYFNGLLEPLRLGWSRERSRCTWGHYDDAHRTIVINQVLDHPRVPSHVVEAILYHEMLHHVHQPRRGRGRKRILHDRAFREHERWFERYDEAHAFLRAIIGRRIRLQPHR